MTLEPDTQGVNAHSDPIIKRILKPDKSNKYFGDNKGEISDA